MTEFRNKYYDIQNENDELTEHIESLREMNNHNVKLNQQNLAKLKADIKTNNEEHENELNKFELTMTYEPIKKLYNHFKDFIDNGSHIKVNIPFPMINRRIKGELMPNKNGDSNICLTHENFN